MVCDISIPIDYTTKSLEFRK